MTIAKPPMRTMNWPAKLRNTSREKFELTSNFSDLVMPWRESPNSLIRDDWVILVIGDQPTWRRAALLCDHAPNLGIG
ncbi:MAG: hypothetical protein HQL86_07160 [Magnetococcales bacterium]|nr:hypothetical protein [Magnetococcales bacterium]